MVLCGAGSDGDGGAENLGRRIAACDGLELPGALQEQRAIRQGVEPLDADLHEVSVVAGDEIPGGLDVGGAGEAAEVVRDNAGDGPIERL